jgi:DNA-binding transcriptional regulator YdaS (Cro superfamily)
MAKASREIDEGLRMAIKAVGSQKELAWRLGMAAASLAEWHRVPSHRIRQVEAVTGIRREQLRPDLYD